MNNFDIYGQCVTIGCDQKGKFKSNIGGILSLGLISLLIVVYFNEIKDFLNRKNMIVIHFYYTLNYFYLKIYNYDQIQIDPSLNLAQKQFMMAINITDIFDDQKYSNKIKYIGYSTLPSGQKIPLVKCQNQHFQNVSKQYSDEILDKIGLETNSYYCIDFQNQALMVYGNYGDEFFDIEFSYNVCSDTNDEQTCIKQQDYDSIIKNTKTDLNIIYTNCILKPEGDELIQYYLSSFKLSTLANIVPLQQILLTKNNFTRDYSIINYITNITQLSFYNIQQQYVTTQYERVNDILQSNPGLQIKISIGLTQQMIIYQQSYKQLSSSLGYLGGITGMLVKIFGFLAIFYNKLQANIMIAYELYKIPTSKEKKRKDDIILKKKLLQQLQLYSGLSKFKIAVNLIQDKIQNYKDKDRLHYYNKDQMQSFGDQILKQIMQDKASNIQSKNQLTNGFIILNQSIHSRKKFLDEMFYAYLHKKQELRFSLKYMISAIFFHKYLFQGDQQVQMIRQSIQKIRDDLNIKTILQKQQEFEKLKIILLSDDQLQVFNYLPKLKIHTDEKPNKESIKQMSLKKKQKQTPNKLQKQGTIYNLIEKEKVLNQQKTDKCTNYQNNYLFLQKLIRLIPTKFQ